MPEAVRTEPNKELLDRLGTALTIEVDGRTWPIPKLAPKQNEVVIPIIMKLWPVFLSLAEKGEEAAAAALAANPDGPVNQLERLRPLVEGDDGNNLKLMYDAIFAALQRGHRSLTRDEFDNEMSVGVMEAFEAFRPIAQQTGLIQFTATGGASQDAPLA